MGIDAGSGISVSAFKPDDQAQTTSWLYKECIPVTNVFKVNPMVS